MVNSMTLFYLSYWSPSLFVFFLAAVFSSASRFLYFLVVFKSRPIEPKLIIGAKIETMYFLRNCRKVSLPIDLQLDTAIAEMNTK